MCVFGGEEEDHGDGRRTNRLREAKGESDFPPRFIFIQNNNKILKER